VAPTHTISSSRRCERRAAVDGAGSIVWEFDTNREFKTLNLRRPGNVLPAFDVQ
jgi:hypothetical protein